MPLQLTESEYLIKALSHDMNANFMLINHSFTRLKRLLSASLEENSEASDAMEHLSACLSEAKDFLDDLVQLAKTGHVEMDATRVELGQIIEDIVFEEESLLLSRGINVEVQHPLPAVRCNEVRLRQVITNLLRNAAIHGCDTEDPRIEIYRCDTKEESDRSLVAIAVHDNGNGITPEDQEKIFLPGERLASSSGEGHGMGLAIVRKIAEHYGGSARIESGRNYGTAMIVTIPAADEGGSVHDDQDVDSSRPARWNLGLDGGHTFPAERPHSIKTSHTRG